MMCENFKSIGANLQISTFLFLGHNSKINQNLKKTSNKVLSRIDYLSFKVIYFKIRELLLPEKMITGKKNIILKSIHTLLCLEFKIA